MCYNKTKELNMKNIKNVVDFADLCIFAEEKKIAFYNKAHDILEKDAYPYPESNFREIYLSEMKYMEDSLAKEILQKFMEENKVKYITVSK